MKKYIFILTVIVISSCNHTQKAEIKNTSKATKKELRPFFDSDKIAHYYLNFSEDEFTKFIRKDNRTKKEAEFSNLFTGYLPNTIPKEDFEKTLLNHNYKKSNLSIKQQNEIQDVFSEKDSLMNYGYACAAEYRDIFVFKKKEKIIGIAKSVLNAVASRL
ncbi:hypothetical protein EOD40_00865 [Flavobacterium sufflavum]|uniref:Uncharacterized protein n=1 Tax=Flavobacterium sufflavum TaxID=1921138 RepID=A0A437L2Z6_9FLAO|nr:hypothetical protein [Flavobacterium sufflavum]RVT79693.1 hypothetical protein EOD40_00865 [Flavobacterium sufflavum]